VIDFMAKMPREEYVTASDKSSYFGGATTNPSSSGGGSVAAAIASWQSLRQSLGVERRQESSCFAISHRINRVRRSHEGFGRTPGCCWPVKQTVLRNLPADNNGYALAA